MSEIQLLKVTIRRDFPLRDGELPSAWRWSSPDGTHMRPHRWSGIPLRANEERPVWGWGIGSPRPAPGNESDNGGSFTTDISDPIAATMEIRRADDEFSVVSRSTSGRNGEAELPTGNLPDGAYIVCVRPDASDADIEVGAALGSGPTPPKLIYRPAEFRIRLGSGRLVEVTDCYDPPNGVTHARIGNRQKWNPEPDHLPVSLKPIWWYIWDQPGPENRPPAPEGDIRLIVVHRTGGARLGGALNGWYRHRTSRSGQSTYYIGAHYVIDTDGHVIKLLQESKRVGHVDGNCRWGGDDAPNSWSIGIEILNASPAGFSEYPEYAGVGDAPFTPEQYRALIGLLRNLKAAFGNIGHCIVGHSDVATGPAKGQSGIQPDRYHTKRNWDPGQHFEWERLEENGLGIVPAPSFNVASDYGGLFQQFPDIELILGDHDRRGNQDARYGNTLRPGFSNEVIREIQEDLSCIGYSLRVNPNNEYDLWTEGAVDRFQRHFFSGTRGRIANGRVGRATAERIKDVVTSLRIAKQVWECWILKNTSAVSVKLHHSSRYHAAGEHGLIGVYRSFEDADREKGADRPWQKPSGTWECWIRKSTSAISVKLHHSSRYHAAGKHGLIGAYRFFEDASCEKGVDRPWRKENL